MNGIPMGLDPSSSPQTPRGPITQRPDPTRVISRAEAIYKHFIGEKTRSYKLYKTDLRKRKTAPPNAVRPSTENLLQNHENRVLQFAGTRLQELGNLQSEDAPRWIEEIGKSVKSMEIKRDVYAIINALNQTSL